MKMGRKMVKKNLSFCHFLTEGKIDDQPNYNGNVYLFNQLFIFRNRLFENWQISQASDIEGAEIEYSERKRNIPNTSRLDGANFVNFSYDHGGARSRKPISRER